MGRSQRHMILEQGSDATGASIGQGVIAPGLLLQAGEGEVTYGAELQGIENIEVPVGPPGGPLQGSTLTGAIPSGIEPGPGPEPVPGLAITSPTEGSTVPPVHDILGIGAVPNAEVQLWYAGQDPGEDPPASTTTADASGNWGFTGDTPAALGPVTWGVYSDDVLVTVSITVEEEAPATTSRRKKAD